MAVTQTGKSRSSTRKSPPAVTKAAPAPKAPRKKAKPAAMPAITPEEWRQRVATAAYLRAEARGFVGGSAEEDWLEAEKEIAARLAAA